jgi:predicted ATPase/DNA-binding SARP family transcriptional activator/tetratricopeptide (TPR) repeat protein
VSHPALTLLDGVRWQGGAVPGARTHTLLAVLTAAAPRAVSAGELVRRVWLDGPPEHPEKALQVLASRTRARTAPQVVELSGAGYRLGLGDTEVDVLELRRLVAEARAAEAASDPDAARLCAEAALAVPVEANGDGSDDAALGELVAAALADRDSARSVLAGAHLSLGDHARAVSLLEPLVERRPHDEQLLGRMLRAEAAARGVPAALTRYAAYADETRDRLGSEPGEQLQRLHLELLARDAPVRAGLKYDAAPMIGRDSDVAAIRALLDHARVVSIVGPGGLGKTRMAHLVGRLAEQPVVQLVELAGVTAPDGVLPEIATAVGVRESVATARHSRPAADLRGRVAAHLVGVPTLLIVDNCEHLVEAVADAVAFLAASVPELRVLTTSRAPLGIAAEQVYQLPQLGESDAIELFRRRALAARPGVRLDDAEIARLVARLDGLPLAIELSAAKVRVMSVADVGRRLEDRFALLRGGDRSAPDRHQTLEAVIDWSWQLLGEGPREALRALSAFPDGFSLSGADAVLDRDALPDITHLAEQSLVVVREDDEVRYRFLETVREYGAQRLDDAGERRRVERSLSAWAVDTSRALGERLTGADQVRATHDTREEAGNLSGVLRRAIELRDAATVVPVVATLTNFWTIQGDHASVFGLTDVVLDLLVDFEPAPDQADELRGVLAELVTGTAILSGLAPDRAMEQLRELGPGTPGTRSNAISRVLLAVFDDDGQQLSTLTELGTDLDPVVARTALIWLCYAQENSGDVAEATATAQRALALADSSSGPWGRAMAESQLAGLAIQAGNPELALACARRALPTMEALGAFEDCVQLRSAIALAELETGDLEAAARSIEAVRADERAQGSLAWTFGATGAAEVELARGDIDRGLDLFRESIDVARNRTYPGMVQPIDLTPWVLFTEAAALVAYIQHGRRDDAFDLAANLSARLPELFGNESMHLDVPVVGGVMVALGEWLLSGPPSSDASIDAFRLLALGERFGYYRGIPSMSWPRARDLAERRAPGVIDQVQAEYAGRSVADLPEEAAAVVQRALR